MNEMKKSIMKECHEEEQENDIGIDIKNEMNKNIREAVNKERITKGMEKEMCIETMEWKSAKGKKYYKKTEWKRRLEVLYIEFMNETSKHIRKEGHNERRKEIDTEWEQNIVCKERMRWRST